MSSERLLIGTATVPHAPVGDDQEMAFIFAELEGKWIIINAYEDRYAKTEWAEWQKYYKRIDCKSASDAAAFYQTFLSGKAAIISRMTELYKVDPSELEVWFRPAEE